MYEEQLEHARRVKAAHERDLMKKPNVIGVGVGLRSRNGEFTGEVAIVVSVSHKIPSCALSPEQTIPSELDGVPVDVHTTGIPHAG